MRVHLIVRNDVNEIPAVAERHGIPALAQVTVILATDIEEDVVGRRLSVHHDPTIPEESRIRDSRVVQMPVKRYVRGVVRTVY